MKKLIILMQCGLLTGCAAPRMSPPEYSQNNQSCLDIQKQLIDGYEKKIAILEKQIEGVK